MNSFVKRAYIAGARKALQDVGITKISASKEEMLLRLLNPTLGAGLGALAGGEDNRLLGALGGAAGGHLGGKYMFTNPGAVVGGLAGGGLMNMIGLGDEEPTLLDKVKGVFE